MLNDGREMDSVLEIAKKIKVSLKESRSLDEISSLLASNSSKSISAKMKWISTLFSKIGVSSLQKLLMERRMEKKKEDSLSHSHQVRNSNLFIKIFENEIISQSSKIGIKIQNEIFNAENYLKVIQSLLEKSKTIGSSSQIESTSSSCTFASSSVNQYRNHTSNPTSNKNEQSKTRKIIDDVPKALNNQGQSQKLNQLESEIQEIKNEYSDMTKKYNQLESLYKEALDFSNGKEFLKKRVFLLKSQNIQLSRYINDIVTELSSKEGFVHEVDDDLYKIRDILARTVVLLSSGKAEKVSNAITELKLTSQYLEALQRQIHRRIKDHTRETRIEDKTPDFEFMSEFISTPKNPAKVSLADICSGSISHLNLKHVSRLESQLHELYDCLLTLLHSLDSCLIPNIHQQISDHQRKIIEETQLELKESISSLLSLSVLVPAAPYPKLDTIRLVGYPSLPSKEVLISSLPACSSSVKAKIGEFWENILHGLNAYILNKDSEVAAISKELDFHKTLYKQYNEKIGNVVEGLEKKRSSLSSDLSGVIVPLEEIRRNISALEFNPVKVGEFLASTDDALATVLNLLHKNVL